MSRWSSLGVRTRRLISSAPKALKVPKENPPTKGKRKTHFSQDRRSIERESTDCLPLTESLSNKLNATQNLLKTKLSEVGTQFLERRLSEERFAISAWLHGSCLSGGWPSRNVGIGGSPGLQHVQFRARRPLCFL